MKVDVWKKILSWVLILAMLLTNFPVQVFALAQENEERTNSPLYQEITVQPGQLVGDTGEIVENEIYGYVVDYELKKGHVLSISNTDYVFSVRQLVAGNYSTLLKQATTDSFTAAEDMTVGMLIRKPDKSALTPEELASVVLYDSHCYESTVAAPTCTEQGYTTYTCTCGDSYMDDYVDATGHSYENGTCTSCGTPNPINLQRKTISILGASISTYAGTSNGAAADTTNSTIRNNVKYYPNTTIPEVTLNDTWWMQVAEDLGLRLLVNNAWSGSAILLERSGTVGAYVDRCVQLHDDTGDNAGEEPDIICIQMGFNDFSYGKDTLGTAEIDYDTLITADGYGTPATTMEATAIMLDKMVKRYPNAEIYMFNHFKRIGQSASDTTLMEELNAAIETVCARFGVKVVDLYTALTNPEHIGDGRLHPNRLGMDVISEAVKRTLVENTAYSVDTHTVSMKLNGVAADYGDDKIVLDGDGFTLKLTPAGDDALNVTVTLGGEDITASAYADGVVSMDAVTADVTIIAESVHTPRNYRWEFDGEDLVCVGDPENALTKNAGTTTDGVFSNTRYALEKTVVLSHERPWVVEWACEGTWRNSNNSSGGRMFTSTDVNADYNARYIFKSANSWLIAMGEKDTAGSHNYGIALSDYGIDGSALHTYRLENRIADDGSNMVWLYVDGEEIGPMDNYYVGTTNKNTTSDWLSGKDFVFPYMGTDTHGFSNCSIEYIQVWEDSENKESLSLRYDDHYDVSGKVVEIIDAGQPTSYQVGYGVEENTMPDTAVVTLEGDILVATGIGTAQVKIDGQLYQVTVEAAPISLLLLIGQSNMRGSEGNANQSIVCPEGMVYATYGDDRGADNTAMTESNAAHFAPSALTGEYSNINTAGTTDCLSGYPVYSLTEAGEGKIGPDSGFAYEWVRQTGEKVWIVNAAHGGTSIKVWQPGTTEYEQCQALFTACQETLRKEIAAGHFTLSHMGYFWCQGCSDRTQSAAWYVEKYLAMHEGFKTELSFDHDSDPATADKTFEFGGIIPVRVGSTAACYRDGVYSVTNSYSYHESFVDLRMNGPRVAQYWMINNPELPDIWGVCNIGDDWVWMPDGTNGVTEYFQTHYENGTVDYTTQVAQKASWYTPTTPKAVHDSVHYNQIGYNEIGRESVRNALIMLGDIESPDVETTVELLTWDGYTEATQVSASTTGNSATLVVPVVYPLWKSKDVTYELSEGIRWEYYDLLADTAETEGVLTAIGAQGSVNVVKGTPGSHFADHLSQLPENVCCGLNLWNVLEHDEYYYASGTHWGIYSGGEVPSVTIPVNPGDHIFATSFGKAGENGHISSNGIRVTFFSEYGVARTLTPAECYAEFSANGGYLVAPEDAVAINIAMWNNSNDNEIYILNLPHDVTDEVCSICGKGSHTHDWSDWETVTEPGPDGPGEQKRNCTCGETETREILSVWQTTDLAQYIQQLPDNTCCGLNLWAVLEHDSSYFVPSRGNWGNHSSRDVPSITIPVNPGDMIFATSFGAADVNGHGSANGIRVTWFDIDGVLKTTDPAGTYAEFAANGGYLSTPEGAIAINIPLWGDSEAHEVYILNRGHTYENGICTGCGEEHPNLANFEGKVISILSASTSTFAGYIPVADGFNLKHRARYPQDNLLTDVNETWWMQVIAELDAKLGINDSWAGSQVLNTKDSNSGDLGPDAAMASLTRIQNLGANGTPDVILFYGGGNDMGRGVNLGSFDPSAAPTEVDLKATKWDSFADAYTAAIMRLQYFYPNTEIVVIMSHEMPNYVTAEKLDQYGAVIKAICEHYGVKYVELRDCGITFDMLPDDIHPNAEGMDYITTDVLNTLLNALEMEAGENVVHSVTHELTNAKASLHYYKGVSEGAAFAETLSGTDLTITVTMGGVDVTSQVYADGTITIPEVTGELVIAARGAFDADGHLQQLPDNICPGTNLWTVLEPENVYYLGTEWGLYTNAPNVHSVTFPVDAGDKLWATSFGPAFGDKTGNGTRITWFDENGVLKSVTRDVVYSEFTKNGCITVPEGAIAVNVPMPTGADTWELYIMSLSHEYVDGVCAICGGEHTTIYDDYLQQLPENICGGTNLWPLLEPVNEYYTANGWGLFDSEPNVHSVTFPVEVGARLWATSFQAAGTNGLTANGTRITWFDENGVLESLTRDVVYAEFAQYGYITVPQNAVAVNIPMASNADTWEVYILNLPHEYETVVTAPTCTEQGYTTHTCAICRDSYMDTYVDAIGHSYSEWRVTKAATCTEGGTERRDCANCDHYEPRAIEATDHDYKSVVTVSTCTEQGYTTHTCSICGDSYVDSYVGASGHSYDAWTVTKAATCTESGTERRDCANCEHYETRTIEATGHDYKAVVTAPTCTEQGYTTYTCSICGDSYVDSYVNASGHSYSAWEVIAEATCTEDGTERRDCTDCDHYETRAIEALGHDYTSIVTAPTCTERGYTTHTCTICGDSYVDSYVNAAGHSYGEWAVIEEATCIESGTERRDCANCDHYETCAIEATGHDYKSVITAPTCMEQGHTIHTCANCSDSYVDSYVNAAGHSYGEWAVIEEATCTESGTERRNCANCDHYETCAIEPTGHDYKSVVTASTCTEQGYTTHTCSICGDSYVDSHVNAAGHSYGGWMVTKAATCTEDGTERRDCTDCDHYETRTIEATGHDYKAVVTAPTCTEQGYTTHTCTICGDSYVDSHVNAAGHSYGGWTVTKAATCTEQGAERRDCANCDHYETRAIEATGHDYKAVVAAPTCMEQGYTTHTCANCSDSYVDSYVNAAGHSYGERAVIEEATCTESGTERRDCTNCDHYETRTIEATGHDYKSVITAPTCTEQGYTTHTCTICGDSYVDSHVNAAGHSYGEWAVIEEATCTESGTERRDCTNCDHYETRAIEALGHDYTSIVTAPTCTEQGYTTHTCSICGDSYMDTYVSETGHSYGDWILMTEPTCTEMGEERRSCVSCDHHEVRDVEATGHVFEKGHCVECGERDPNYIPGDINGDGAVNNKDLTRLFQHLSDWDVEVVEDALDINGDGAVNNKDLTRLFQYLSDWDVEIF